jgi:hypothetical protein
MLLQRFWAAALLLSLSACVSNTLKTTDELRRDRPVTKVLIMPLDVELMELTVGGYPEPRADWTDAAIAHMKPALLAERSALRLEAVDFKDDNHPPGDDVFQVSNLHGAVGAGILVSFVQPLPTRQGKFEWSLGPKVTELSRHYDADYALFVYVRDSYSSDARKAAMVAFALLGVAIPGGIQLGFASLVDLKTGEIVWFNRLARGVGDLRTPDAASETVKVLLAGFPK